MNERSREQGFERYLERKSALSRRYRELDDDAPSPELDAGVLAEARHAIEGSAAARRKSIRWLAPLVLAASVVVTVGIVLDVLGPPAVEPAKKEATIEPEPSIAPRVPVDAAAASQNSRPDAVRRQAPSPPVAGPHREFTPDIEPEFAADVEVPVRSESSAAAKTAARSGKATVENVTASPAMRAQEPASAAPAETSALARDHERADAGNVASSLADPEDPDAWLDRIEALREAGRVVEAEAELERFRNAFPDYPSRDRGTSRE